MTTEPEQKPRFEVNYIGQRGRERLDISCNFPEFEKGLKHMRRTYFGPRAKRTVEEMQRRLKQSDSLLEDYIVNHLGVGGTKFVVPHVAIPDFKNMVDNAMSNLGKMQSGIRV